LDYISNPDLGFTKYGSARRGLKEDRTLFAFDINIIISSSNGLLNSAFVARGLNYSKITG
jgi:hypothetical protein